jgi:hypothetical protein
MNFLKKYWKQISIVILLIAIGVLLALLFRKSPNPVISFKPQIDSLQRENKRINKYYERKSDSIDKVVISKEKLNADLSKKIESITQKYIALRNASPDHDTIVRRDTLYKGMECIEKYKILEAKFITIESTVGDLKLKVIYKDEQVKIIQKQLESSLGINLEQDKALKKAQRKLKWAKAFNYIEGALVLGAITYMIVKK